MNQALTCMALAGHVPTEAQSKDIIKHAKVRHLVIPSNSKNQKNINIYALNTYNKSEMCSQIFKKYF